MNIVRKRFRLSNLTSFALSNIKKPVGTNGPVGSRLKEFSRKIRFYVLTLLVEHTTFETGRPKKKIEITTCRF